MREPQRPLGHGATSDCQQGFTFLEVLFAVLILLAALVPILGLQNAALDRTARNALEEDAVLIARQTLSFIESSPSLPTTGTISGPAFGILQRLSEQATRVGYVPLLPERLEPYTIRFTAEPWQVEGLPPGVVTRLTVVVSWSEDDDPRDNVTVTYIIPSA